MSKRVVITIGRQCGSGGREIGQELAKSLNIPFYDKELLAMAAEKSGISQSLLEDADETATNSLLYSLVMGANSFGAGVPTMADLPITDKLFIAQTEIIREVAQMGSCVIVGRCADYILKDDPDCVSVFITADINERIQRVKQRHNLSAKKAEDSIAKTDKKRANYYNRNTDKRWGNASSYMLCVDSKIGIDNTVSVIKNYIECLKESEK